MSPDTRHTSGNGVAGFLAPFFNPNIAREGAADRDEVCMDDVPRNGHQVQCPLCEGLGHFRRADLIARLSDPRFMEKIAGWRKALTETNGPCEEQQATMAESFENKVRSWPSSEILWRRSPKE